MKYVVGYFLRSTREFGDGIIKDSLPTFLKSTLDLFVHVCFEGDLATDQSK